MDKRAVGHTPVYILNFPDTVLDDLDHITIELRKTDKQITRNKLIIKSAKELVKRSQIFPTK